MGKNASSYWILTLIGMSSNRRHRHRRCHYHQSSLIIDKSPMINIIIVMFTMIEIIVAVIVVSPLVNHMWGLKSLSPTATTTTPPVIICDPGPRPAGDQAWSVANVSASFSFPAKSGWLAVPIQFEYGVFEMFRLFFWLISDMYLKCVIWKRNMFHPTGIIFAFRFPHRMRYTPQGPFLVGGFNSLVISIFLPGMIRAWELQLPPNLGGQVTTWPTGNRHWYTISSPFLGLIQTWIVTPLLSSY